MRSAGIKPYRCSIVACARWEQPYVVEWIRYHIDLGFDHIYLYCNDDDPAALKSVLADLAPNYRARITYRPFFGQGLQRAMYTDALRQAKRESDWLCFLDIDEFLVLKVWRSIGDLIEHLDAKAVVSCYFNWVFFGNNGHATRPTGSVLENYTRRASTVDPHTKHISRASCFEADRINGSPFPIWHGLIDPHWAGFNRRNVLGDDAGRLLDNFPAAMSAYLAETGRSEAILSTAYVAHYVFKSADDFRFRVARGLGGNFGGQAKWLHAIETGETEQILGAMNEVEDRSVRDAARQAEISTRGLPVAYDLADR